jgi:lipid-A-disaccharide synthase
MNDSAGILFTAFEPSGDEHAAPVIAAIRKSRPDLPIWALGGERMRAAGAELIEETTQRPVMFLGAAKEAWAHYQRIGRLKRWLAGRRIGALVPVDSPAANWSICGLIRRNQPQAKVVHLVAPQLWAWAPWRIKKMRRLSDHVLCLLPFEEEWFKSRGMAATFVGHPVFDAEEAPVRAGTKLSGPTEGTLKLALLPGSRSAEIRSNLPTMLGVYQELARKHTGLVGFIAARDERCAGAIGEVMKQCGVSEGLPAGPGVRIDQTEEVLAWSDLVLVASGTATLHVAAHRRPMVVIYNMNMLLCKLVLRWIVQTRTFSLPNLIAERAGLGRIVPELVPHDGSVKPVLAELERFINSLDAREAQLAGIERVASLFQGHRYSEESARAILGMIDAGSDW